jgi:hypothetical protein
MSMFGAAANVMKGAGVLGAVAGADTALFLGQDVIEPALEGVVNDSLTRGVGDLRQEQVTRLREMMRLRRLRDAKAANLERLARVHPDVYNQIATGRQLPKGSFVIGGSPDEEALDRVAMMMSQGQL